MLYLYLMISKNELTEQLIKDLFEHLKQLDAEDKLVLCGPFHDYPGSMVVFNADNYGQAILIAESDPFIHSGCKTYELRSLEVANKDNQYLL
ncbi:YciI family protein [Streptococcus parasuis]|uniref:YciI family protein n=1 Tax=Streptococcus parasuis TaxID=1501662 RepID=UPI003AAE7E8C